MPDALRVALVDHCAQMGGGEWSLLRLATMLDREVVEPVVVLGEDGPLAGRLRRAGIDVEICALAARFRERRKETLWGGRIAEPTGLAALGRAVHDLRQLFLRLGVEIVHTNSLKAHVAGGVAGRLAGARVLWHVRDHIAAPYLPGAAVRAVRLAASHVPHEIIAVSESVARTVGRENLRVVHQGVPPPPPGRPKREGPPRVGIVGRIAPWKGQDVFLAAAERLVAEFPEAEFVLAGAPLFGEQEFEAELRRRAARPPLAGKAHFLGLCDDVWPVYRSLDVVVHASVLPEPYGNVIVEAMAAGTALVASAAGGALELVDDGRTGLLVAPGDDAALAEAVGALLRDPERRRLLAAAAGEEVAHRFSLERDARRVEQIYRELAR